MKIRLICLLEGVLEVGDFENVGAVVFLVEESFGFDFLVFQVEVGGRLELLVVVADLDTGLLVLFGAEVDYALVFF